MRHSDAQSYLRSEWSESDATECLRECPWRCRYVFDEHSWVLRLAVIIASPESTGNSSRRRPRPMCGETEPAGVRVLSWVTGRRDPGGLLALSQPSGSHSGRGPLGTADETSLPNQRRPVAGLSRTHSGHLPPRPKTARSTSCQPAHGFMARWESRTRNMAQMLWTARQELDGCWGVEYNTAMWNWFSRAVTWLAKEARSRVGRSMRAETALRSLNNRRRVFGDG